MPHRRLTEADVAQGTLRANSFALLTGTTRCAQCHGDTRASAILLRGYEQFSGGDWICERRDALLAAIFALDAATYQVIATEAPWMLFAHTSTCGTYLAAYCEHCSAVQDRRVLTQPEGVFFPLSEEAVGQLEARWFRQPVLAQADTSWSSWTDWVPDPSNSLTCTGVP